MNPKLQYWRTLVTNRNMAALCVMYIPNCMIFYFCITWLLAGSFCWALVDPTRPVFGEGPMPSGEAANGRP